MLCQGLVLNKFRQLPSSVPVRNLQDLAVKVLLLHFSARGRLIAVGNLCTLHKTTQVICSCGDMVPALVGLATREVSCAHPLHSSRGNSCGVVRTTPIVQKNATAVYVVKDVGDGNISMKDAQAVSELDHLHERREILNATTMP